jgi:hypothetical protein
MLHLRLTWRYVSAFAALTILCGTSHEFVHHFAGAAICGGFGVKTFNSFDLAPGCDANPLSVWATAAGPLFTFALMWWGLHLLGRADERRRHLGFALIFANFPVNRMAFALAGWNDEQWVARHALGPSRLAFWVTVCSCGWPASRPSSPRTAPSGTAAARSGSPGSSCSPSRSSSRSRAGSSRATSSSTGACSRRRCSASPT